MDSVIAWEYETHQKRPTVNVGLFLSSFGAFGESPMPAIYSSFKRFFIYTCFSFYDNLIATKEFVGIASLVKPGSFQTGLGVTCS